MNKYKIGKCKICSLTKALKNDICIDCEKLPKAEDLFGLDNFGIFSGFGGN